MTSGVVRRWARRGDVRRSPPSPRWLLSPGEKDALSVIMVPPVQVSPLIKMARYSALLVVPIETHCLCFIYNEDYLKPIAEEERRIEAEEKKKRDELERIAKQLAEANEDTILK
ncbi:hypothetical protein chiPu_0010962 [Chiloscyllium punctatum]|uniref:ATP synthase F(0) complex subunit e, mitochondrial n=1 Tax=Chiloscyllium punctatum TaxID=137246 RepID=A0A401SQ28_CHIPU|nr:hypothetical protein [Chiloscyllium punctatum]